MTITIRITNEGNEGDAQVGVYDAQNNLKGELMQLPRQPSGHAFLVLVLEDGDAITVEPFGQEASQVDDETPEEKASLKSNEKTTAKKIAKSGIEV